MRVNIDINRAYTPDEIKEIMGWGDNLDLEDVSRAVMVLCDTVKRLETRCTEDKRGMPQAEDVKLQDEIRRLEAEAEIQNERFDALRLERDRVNAAYLDAMADNYLLEAENERLRRDITALTTGDAPGDMVEHGTGSLTSISGGA